MVRAETYEELALEDGDDVWELDHGCLRKKPPVSNAHSWSIHALLEILLLALDGNQFRVRVNHARTRLLNDRYYVPDLVVVPTALARQQTLDEPARLETYTVPLPLVVEVWSPSTGEYDVAAKLPEYQARGDLEIWYLHPYEKSLTAWRRQPDGSYTETTYRSGVVVVASLPDVSVELASLFA